MSLVKKKEIAYKIIKSLNKDDNSISVTLTGSYSEHFDTKRAGDIDIIIVCKKLNKTFFNKCISKLKILKRKYFNNDYDLMINSTFGPIKYYKKNTIVFHLMIYDLDSHIKHTINSPFTCYDWERSKIYVGKSLKELSPVYKLQYRDFSEARRSTKEYLNDLSKNRISYREYVFKKSKYKIVKKYFKIDQLNKRDFIYHIINFLLINYIKYERQANLKIDNKSIEKKFLDIVNSKKILDKFIKLRNFKNNKNKLSINDPKKFALNFINKFDDYIKKRKTINQFFFSRHKKTTLSNKIFLGQKLDPNIIDKKNQSEFIKINFDNCFSSPASRCFDTAKIVYSKRKIIVSNYLKEIDYGDVEGSTVKELSQKYPNIPKMWNLGLDPKFPNGESLKDVSIRLDKFLKQIIKMVSISKKSNYLIFSHNVVLRCLIGKIFKINRKEWFRININYFDLLEFQLERGKLLSNIDRNKYLSIFKNFY